MFLVLSLDLNPCKVFPSLSLSFSFTLIVILFRYDYTVSLLRLTPSRKTFKFRDCGEPDFEQWTCASVRLVTSSTVAVYHHNLQSARALMCVSAWQVADYIKNVGLYLLYTLSALDRSGLRLLVFVCRKSSNYMDVKTIVADTWQHCIIKP